MAPVLSNATLDGATGAFSFHPDASQVGVHTLTFAVSDGKATDSETVTITVNPGGGVTALTGVILDAVDGSTPVVGATVSLVGDTVTAVTDGTGAFTLSGIPSGDQIVNIDASTAALAPDGSAYGSAREDENLIAAVTNELTSPISLARIDATTAVTVDPAQTTTLSSATLNVTLTAAAGTVFESDGTTPYTGQLTVSDLPSAQIASALPPFISPCRVVTIQPPGVVFNPSADIVLPNLDGLPAATQVDIWVLDPNTGRFGMTGTGTVDAGGATISASAVIPYSSAVFAVPSAPATVASADMNGANETPSLLADGNVSTAIQVPTYQSFGVRRGPTLVYNSSTAAPQPIVASSVTMPVQAGVPGTVESVLQVNGVQVAGPVYTTTSVPQGGGAPLAAGQTIRVAMTFDACGFATGSYPYRLISTSNFGCSKVGAATEGKVLINNESQSPFGAGWSLAGLQKLKVEADGAVLTEGDGSVKRFSRGDFSPPTAYPSPAPEAMALEDMDGDGNLDAVVPDPKNGKLRVYYGDGVNQFTQILVKPAGTALGNDTLSVATADFNKDGRRDMVAANAQSKWVSVHFANAPRDFANRITYLLGPLPTSVAVADFNGDGNDDFAVSRMGDINAGPAVIFFFGNGVGGFPNTGGVGTTARPISIAAGDLNNDGAPDVVALSVANDTLDILLNNGTGAFTRQSIPAGNSTEEFFGLWMVAIGDFNGDGNKDLAASIEGTTKVSFWPGNGTGTFPQRFEIDTGTSSVSSVLAADVNKDGFDDIVVAHRLDPTVTILLSDGKGGFPVRWTTKIGSNGNANAMPADFNKDSKLDLIVGSRYADDTLYLSLADTDENPIYTRPVGEFSSLVANANGTYTRTLTDGTTIEFNAAGYQTAMIDPNTNGTSYLYNAAGQIAQIIDPVGRTTTFAYLNGELDTITDPAGRVTSFAHDDLNLASAVYADSSGRRYVYDSAGRVVMLTSLRGYATSHDYGPAGEWIGTTFPDGASISGGIAGDLGLDYLGLGLGSTTDPAPYTADADGIASITDARQNTTTMKLNSFGAPVEITDAVGRVTTLVRNADNKVTQATMPSDGELPDGSTVTQVVTQLDYDGAGNVTAKREAVGTSLERQTRYQYEPTHNRLTMMVDPTNTSATPTCDTAGVTCYQYDANGNMTQTIKFANGAQFPAEIRTYYPLAANDGGKLNTRTDANGKTTTYVYNTENNLANVTDPLGNRTDFGYDPAGNVSSRTEGFGTAEQRVTSTLFDLMNRRIMVTDGANGVTFYRHDAGGNEVEVIDPTNVSVTKTYDQMDRLTEENNPAQGPVVRTYDPNGNLETVTNALQKTVTLVYDPVNRVSQTTDPLTNNRFFGYDKQNNRTTVTDARGNPTTFVFDPLKRKIRRTNPLGQAKTYAYDSRNNEVSMTDAKGQKVQRAYDELNRLTAITTILSDGTTVEDTTTFTYDGEGNRLTAADGDSSLAFTYDELNRLKTAQTVVTPDTVQPARVLTNTYDAVGNRTVLTHGPDAVTVDGTWTYGYDREGRLTSLVTPAGDPMNPIGLSYDGTGRLTEVAYPNTTATRVNYDAVTGRPSQIAHTQASAPFASYDYTFRDDGLIQSITEPAGVRNFTYDNTQQLTGGGVAAAPESYAYDAEGNRTSSHLSASYTHDDANRLLEDDSACYAHDANGNLSTKTEKVAGACTGGETTFAWDVRNRLTGITFPDASTASYRYDADGRRIEKDVNGVLTRYVYDDDDILLEYDGANALQATYGHGKEVDQPLSVERGGQIYYYLTDHLGSVRGVTGAGGTVANSYDTDSFGRFELRSESVPQPYAFTARVYDPQSGLNFYRARYYSAAMGRFISEDPIGLGSADLNHYRYVFNGPQALIDPTGKTAAHYGRLVTTVGCVAVGGVIFASSYYVDSATGELVAMLGLIGCTGTTWITNLEVLEKIAGAAAVGFVLGGSGGYALGRTKEYFNCQSENLGGFYNWLSSLLLDAVKNANKKPDAKECTW